VRHAADARAGRDDYSAATDSCAHPNCSDAEPGTKHFDGTFDPGWIGRHRDGRRNGRAICLCATDGCTVSRVIANGGAN